MSSAVVSASFVSALIVSTAFAGSLADPLNDSIPGEISGRVQFLGMHRDFEHGLSGSNATLGTLLGYDSPQFGTFDFGVAYNHAFELFDGGDTAILLNDDIHVLNEAWFRVRPDGGVFDDLALTAGRKIIHGEVFREDDYRQKARSVEGLEITSTAFENLTLSAGHALRMSNWIDLGDRWDFNNFGDVFGTGSDTDGLTWLEGCYTGWDKWNVTVFNACAWDISNLTGLRLQHDFCDEAAAIGYYRHEEDIGRAASRHTDAWGMSYRQKLGAVTIEPGLFSVHGDGLLFQEATTGINHPLGVSMLICTKHFDGGARTAFISASGKLGRTSLYLLYNYTWRTATGDTFDAEELNLVVKHPVTENLAVALKAAVGQELGHPGTADRTLSDARLFVTLAF